MFYDYIVRYAANILQKMLPFFNLTLAEKNMSHMDHVRCRRRKIDVPVHGSETGRKTYGANFNSRRKHKVVDFEETNPPSTKADFDSTSSIPEKAESKLSRKFLVREIERLTHEKNELEDKFNNDESLFTKKLTRLKEKLNAFENANNQIQNENNVLQHQYQELVLAYEEMKAQLESKKNCRNCEQLKEIVEKSSADYNLLRSNNKDLLEDINMLKNVVYR